MKLIPPIKIRVSPLGYAIAALTVLEVVLVVVSLTLPWGLTSSGSDIRFTLAGLLPWFGFIPVFLQAGFLIVDSRSLRTLYVVGIFVVGAFIILVHSLTYLQYSEFEFGFYTGFTLGAAVLLAGALCMTEQKYFDRMAEKGKARSIPVSFG